MFEELDEQFQQSINTLMGSLPNNPYVIDVVGKAVKIAYDFTRKEEITDDFAARLSLAIQAADYASKVSKPMYYATHLVQAMLLTSVPEEEYAVLDTASGALKNTTAALGSFLKEPSFKKRWLIMLDLRKKDPQALALILMILIASIKGLEGEENLSVSSIYTILGIAYLELALRTCGLQVPSDVYPYKNELTNLILNHVDF